MRVRELTVALAELDEAIEHYIEHSAPGRARVRGLGRCARVVGQVTPQDDGRRPQGRVGCEHAVVAMAMPSGRRDQCREMVEQFQTLERERRAGTVTQQALQAGAIVRAHAHRGIERESAVLPGQHFADIGMMHVGPRAPTVGRGGTRGLDRCRGDTDGDAAR